jgi:TRAP-type C4-dicarboxylate transport system permease small subunit
MFGIPDPNIWIVYILSIVCVLFSAWFGIRYWNEEDDESGQITSIPRRKKKKRTKKATK